MPRSNSLHGNVVPLSIPLRHQRPLAQLHELTSTEPAALINTLNGVAAFASFAAIRRELESLWPVITSDEVQAILMTLVSLASQLSQWDPDELGRLVSESEQIQIEDTDRERFGHLLTEVLQLDTLQVTAKAAAVSTRQEHVFQDASIMTDIRPVFGDDPTEEPAGAVLLHTLSLDHFTEGHTHTFNVALDADDLARLKAVVDRAEAKARSVARIVAAAGLSLFELGGDDAT